MIINGSDIRKIVAECIQKLREEVGKDTLEDTVASTMSQIKEFISDFGLDVKPSRISHTGWVGIYRAHSVKTGVMRIGVDLDVIRNWSNELEDEDIDSEEEARYQVMVSLWHECGHALFEHVKYCRRRSNAAGDGRFKGKAGKDTTWLMGYDEEDLVEEFGEYMAGLMNSSDLFNYLIKYKDILRYEG